MAIFCRLIMFFWVATLFMGSAAAKNNEQTFFRNFWYPTYAVQRLNYCMLDGKECGHSVANQYCKMLGYERSGEEIIDYNVGVTNILSTHAHCKGWRCDGFKLITCVGRFGHKCDKDYYYRSKRFVFPRFNHYRVDWCYENKKGCGKRAAFSFCRRMGYMHAQGFTKQVNVPATKALSNQKLCFGNQCNGFSDITCYR